LPKVALQRFVATLIYALVNYTNNRCKVATHNDGLWQRLYVFVKTMGEQPLWFVVTNRFGLLQHLHVLQEINYSVINII
jgi:hypothetical protein